MRRLLLIDGNAILHRAYHALPPLTNTKGEVVNAVYGFLSMLLTVMSDLKPECVVVCFDRPKPTFRQAIFAEYQQHRPKMADDLVPQVGIIHALLEKMKVAVFELDGYEADDLLGTIAIQVAAGSRLSQVSDDAHQPLSISLSKSRSLSERRQSEENLIEKMSESAFNSSESDKAAVFEVVILSGDRDLLQLVNGQVKVLAPVVGVKNTILYDSVKVKEKYGITPGQMVDYKALVGDASDGYSGVPGVGPKTAVNLLQNYRTLEGIYGHKSELNAKLIEKLEKGSEKAVLCKRLATIVVDAPITFKLEDCLVNKLVIQDWIDAFSEQGFKSLIKKAEAILLNEEKEKKAEKKQGEQLGLI